MEYLYFQQLRVQFVAITRGVDQPPYSIQEGSEAHVPAIPEYPLALPCEYRREVTTTILTDDLANNQSHHIYTNLYPHSYRITH